jgi:translocation and assembly module TamA
MTASLHRVKTLVTIVICLLLVCSSFAARAANYHVTIYGLNKTMLANANKRIEISAKAMPSKPSAEDLQKFFEQVPHEIQLAIQPYGYFKAVVTERHPSSSRAIYSINLGAPIRLTEYEVIVQGPGRHHPDLKKVLSHLPLQKNDILNIDAYDDTQRTLFKFAETRGFIKASIVEKKITLNLKTYRAGLKIVFDTGVQYYYGPVHFKQTTFYSRFLKRYVPFKTGQPYSTGELLTLQDALQGSSYFETVAIKPHTDATENLQIPIDVILTPRKAKTFTFGVGYGTDTGVRGTLGSEFRYLTATGHRLQTMLQVSSVINSLQARYLIPGSNPVTDQYSLNATLFNFITPNDGSSIASKLGVGYSTLWRNWKINTSLNSLLEHTYSSPNKPTSTQHVLYPFITLNKVKADDPLFPTQGYSLNANVRFGSQYLLSSNNNFIQVFGTGKYVYPISTWGRVVARGTLGYSALAKITDLPLSMQFFAGGSQSIRGFSYNSIGPGSILIATGLEYQQKVYDQWYAIGYYDAGNASSSIHDPLLQSFGFGVMRRTIVGPISISIARQLHGKGVRLVFNMGPDLA